MSESYPVGKIVGAFGLKGEVKVEPLTDFLERMHKGSRLRLKGEWITVDGFRMQKGRPLLKLEGIDNANDAQALQWQVLESTATERPDLEEDEFFTADLIGMHVKTIEGLELGLVTDVLELPAHDVIQVGEIMIPAIKEFIKDVDIDNEVLTVQLIPGMLPDP